MKIEELEKDLFLCLQKHGLNKTEITIQTKTDSLKIDKTINISMSGELNLISEKEKKEREERIKKEIPERW